MIYYLCDCNTIKEILEYNGSIHQLKQRTQDFLGYKFFIIHRVATMMKDVDDFRRYVDPFVHQYNITVARLHVEDVTDCPFAYILIFLFAAPTYVMLKLLMHSSYLSLHHPLLRFPLFIISPLNFLQYLPSAWFLPFFTWHQFSCLILSRYPSFEHHLDIFWFS